MTLATTPRPFARAPLAQPLPRPSHPLLDRLWSDYVKDVPHVRTFTRLCGGTFQNDHIALRTLARRDDGIARTARIFEWLGWKQAGDYTFPDVHLRAVHLSRPGYPRVFISELDPQALPGAARAALNRLQLPAEAPDDFDGLARFFTAPLVPPRGADLDAVGPASQYGAWLLAFGRRVNHFTALVDDVEQWQSRMKGAGVPMKGEIEGAPGGDLRQTATAAAPLDVPLAEGGVRTMPYAYFEIAERHRGFDGFLGPQARQLFDMTRPADPKGGAELRRHPRKPAVLYARVRMAGEQRTVMTENLSLGGVFLQLPGGQPLRRGQQLQLQIELPDGAHIEVGGSVVYVIEGRGAGIEFGWWDTQDHPGRAKLAKLLFTTSGQ